MSCWLINYFILRVQSEVCSIIYCSKVSFPGFWPNIINFWFFRGFTFPHYCLLFLYLIAIVKCWYCTRVLIIDSIKLLLGIIFRHITLDWSSIIELFLIKFRLLQWVNLLVVISEVWVLWVLCQICVWFIACKMIHRGRILFIMNSLSLANIQNFILLTLLFKFKEWRL